MRSQSRPQSSGVKSPFITMFEGKEYYYWNIYAYLYCRIPKSILEEGV